MPPARFFETTLFASDFGWGLAPENVQVDGVVATPTNLTAILPFAEQLPRSNQADLALQAVTQPKASRAVIVLSRTGEFSARRRRSSPAPNIARGSQSSSASR